MWLVKITDVASNLHIHIIMYVMYARGETPISKGRVTLQKFSKRTPKRFQDPIQYPERYHDKSF